MVSRTMKRKSAARGHCRNCGEPLIADYCAWCGQPERDGHPPTIGHFVHDLFHEFLHLDGKIFRSLKALFFEPGRLTEEYWAGHVASWIRPIRLFLTIVLLQVLITPGEGPLNHEVMVGRTQEGALEVGITTHTRWLREQTGRQPVPEEVRREFAHRFEKTYASIRYFSVLVFGAASWLLYRRRQPFFVSHLIAGLHFCSFWYALSVVASFPARWDPAWNDLSVLAAVYLFLMLGRIFHERWYLQLAKTVVLTGLMILTELGLGYAAAAWIEH